MTNEEAIEILKQFKKCLSDVVFDEKGSEAWQMAIKALENHDTFMKYSYEQGKKDALSQEPCRVKNELNVELNELKPCTDAVSRKDVLDLLSLYINDTTMIEEDVKQLPSVTQKSGKWLDYSDEGYVECPFCGHATTCEDNIDELHYCFFCGAELSGEEQTE